VTRLVLLAIALAVVAVLVLAARRPDTFRIERSVVIDAAPERIFPLIADLRAFATWSPFERKDPAMRRTYSGPASGPGATYDFDGNNQVGKGRVQITGAEPPRRVTMTLDMHSPMEAHNVVEFTLAPSGGATTVTWAMHGPSPFIGKLLGIFMDMDGMVGRDFEAGLATLKAAAEAPSLASPAP
jgi:uncharacterized protein YndB with AHSA1/START domain